MRGESARRGIPPGPRPPPRLEPRWPLGSPGLPGGRAVGSAPQAQGWWRAGDDADLWVATLDRGLLHWRAGAAETIADALPDKTVLSLAASGDAVYAGTALGVAELRGGVVARTLAPGYFAQSLYAADGKLWMGTLEEGMLEVPLDARAARGVGLRATEVCPRCSIKKIFRMESEIYTVAEDSLWRGTQTVLHAE